MKMGRIFFSGIIMILISLFSYSNINAQWTIQESGTNCNLNSIHFVNTNTGFCVGNSGTIRKTTNGGNNWNTITSPLIVSFNYVRMFGTSNIIIGSSDSGIIIKSTNEGNNWSVMTLNIPYNTIMRKSHFASFTHGFYIIKRWTMELINIYHTTDGCQSWNNIWINCPWNYFGTSNDIYFINENTGWLCNQYFEHLYPIYPYNYSEVIKTTNAGVNWIVQLSEGLMGNDEIEFRVFFKDQNTGFVNQIEPNHSYLRRTSNGGLSWSYNLSAGTTKKYCSFSFPSSDTGWFTGEQTIKSVDGGNDWSVILTPGGDSYNSIYFINNQTGWIAGNNGLLAKTVSGGVYLKPISNEIPESYKLYQNYPNPFNPKTNIRFDLHKSSDVKLIVFDILGKEVSTLVNEKLSAGSYEVEFDGEDYSSGVYFYRLVTIPDGRQAENFTEVKKMLLLK